MGREGEWRAGFDRTVGLAGRVHAAHEELR